jgi:hypothetical protein
MNKVKHFLNNLFGSYAKGEISGYWIGYEVAMEEFTAKFNSDINIYDDFETFKSKLKEEYGIDYVQKTEQFFAQFANLREAVSAYSVFHPTHVKLLKSYQYKDYRIIHLIKLLTEVYLRLEDNESLGKAKSYTKLGINLLDKNESYYDCLINIFSGFQQKIMGREWENN